MRVRGVVALLVAGSVAWPLRAFAYGLFDSTDAAVADMGDFEVELGPLSYRHDDDGIAWIAPQARLNYGFAQDWEVVLEGQAEHFSRERSRLTENALSLKGVLQEGSLQDKEGWSLATEASVLLPGIFVVVGVGLVWFGFVCWCWVWGCFF